VLGDGSYSSEKEEINMVRMSDDVVYGARVVSDDQCSVGEN